jgi:hypothetical protein
MPRKPLGEKGMKSLTQQKNQKEAIIKRMKKENKKIIEEIKIQKKGLMDLFSNLKKIINKKNVKSYELESANKMIKDIKKQFIKLYNKQERLENNYDYFEEGQEN